MELAPVILFTYNRLKHTQATIEALKRNREAGSTELIIYSDGPADPSKEDEVEKVRAYLATISGFKRIELIKRERNYGLDRNIIEGISDMFRNYERVIVLEDDLITSPYFLKYMNEGLELYSDNEKVISIHGYTYPVTINLPESFFIRGADCWGWATWKRGWAHFEENGSHLLQKIESSHQTHSFDFNNSYPFTRMLKDQISGKTRSWAIRWYASAFLKNKLTLYPGRSLVFNAGGDGSGTNVGRESAIDVSVTDQPVNLHPVRPEQDDRAYAAFASFYYKLMHPSLWYRIKRKLKKLLSSS